jgi:pimeloyl-ACP methyl ester carboxylesterase
MNRCRLWLSQTMIRLASHDIQSLMFDLPGTGDSALPWPAARWDHWVEATRQAIAWGYKTGSTHVLAVRFGALLAAAACHNMPDKAASLILAAAQESGAMVLRSLLRVAGNPATLSQRLDAGDTIVAGGYVLHSSLTGPILQQKLGPLLDGLELKRAALDLTGVPSPWLQIEPEEPAALVESTVRQLLQLIGRAT